MRTALLFIALAACTNDGSATTQAKATDEPHKLAGVYPDKFECKSIATTDVLAQALGGSVRELDSPSSVPRGVPHPCTYEVVIQQPPEYWTFDFDCRDGMKQRADALFKQYTQTSAELVEAYNGAMDAGPQPGARRDAGVRDKDAGIDAPQRAPEQASEVMVGLKGLDHHGQGLIFIDDDAPCYVRVVGPDGARRLELAKLVAKNLTFANAPMTPRPFK
ncbi:hypothetical protein BH11MYX3_BH11MYX3_47610 [soil metagenome]